MKMNILLDSILASETATYQREKIEEMKKNSKLNKIMIGSWVSAFLIFLLYL
jgi:hypothetical protein